MMFFTVMRYDIKNHSDTREVHFLKPKKCRKILNGLALTAAGIYFLSYLPFLSSVRGEIIFAATLLLISDAVFGFIFLRCPHCKKLLNFKWSSQSICHNCGERLDEDK